MKKVFYLLLFVILIFSFGFSNSKAATESAFSGLNNFTTSFDIGSFMQNNYNRWIYNTKTQKCEQVDYKSDDDYATESECKADNTKPAYTLSDSFLNSNWTNWSVDTDIEKPTKSSEFQISDQTNSSFNINDFWVESETPQTAPSVSQDVLNGSNFDFNLNSSSVTNQKTEETTPWSFLGLNLDKPSTLDTSSSSKPLAISGLKNLLTSALEGLGFIKPASVVNEDSVHIAIAPTSPDQKINPLVFNPLTDYCDVKFEGAEFEEKLQQISLMSELSKCNESYPIYFSMEYTDSKDKHQESFIRDDSGDGYFNKKFIIPDDIKIVDDKTKVIFNVYQCRPDENWHQKLSFDPDCLDDIKSHKTNYYKQDSYTKEFVNLNKDGDSTNTCNYNIVYPIKNKIYTQGEDYYLPIDINVYCNGVNDKQIPTTIDIEYKIICQELDGTIQGYENPFYYGKTSLEYIKPGDYRVDSLNLRNIFYRKGDIDKCLLSMIVNDDADNYEQLSSEFRIKPCVFNLNSYNSNKTKFYLDDPYIPFAMHTTCDNFDFSAVSSIDINCSDQMLAKSNNSAEYKFVVAITKGYVRAQKSDKDLIISIPTKRFVNELQQSNIEFENFVCLVFGIRYNDGGEAFSSPLAKTSQITFYNNNRPTEEQPFPNIEEGISTSDPQPSPEPEPGPQPTEPAPGDDSDSGFNIGGIINSFFDSVSSFFEGWFK